MLKQTKPQREGQRSIPRTIKPPRAKLQIHVPVRRKKRKLDLETYQLKLDLSPSTERSSGQATNRDETEAKKLDTNRKPESLDPSK